MGKEGKAEILGTGMPSSGTPCLPPPVRFSVICFLVSLRTLGSLVVAPGLMIVQKVAIKSLGGGGSRKTQLSRSRP